MYISRLALDHFRSWEQCLLDLAPGITIFYGNNGLGKTNIVEAVEFLSTGLSHRTHSAKPLIQAGQSSAHIRANVVTSSDNVQTNETTYSLTLSSRGGHRARINNGNSLYLRDIVGEIPSVTFAPEDQQLISSDPSVRRHFLDSAAVSLVPGYYELLQRYNHIAKQRVALLKNVAQMRANGQTASADLSQIFTGLEIWTSQLVTTGIELTQARLSVTEKLRKPFERIYQHIAGTHNRVDLEYVPSYEEILVQGQSDKNSAYDDIINHYQRIYEGEVAQARNLIGPHRDDVVFHLNEMNAREYASNGEMWSLALALKMALYEVISRESRENEVQPLLILDDVFAQLDNSRRSQIIDFASNLQQVLITVAAKDDVPEQLLSENMKDRVHFVDVEALRATERVLSDVPDLDEFMRQSEKQEETQ
ncbi:DNA replication/repair protein RecF [Alloscardovia venturai]|uniref:DNA replication and repair protein RecF n=1 Tax=Alloscardovia venturai TaxID=1769421 RepID=A0ABW2Y3C6_9BIFI